MVGGSGFYKASIRGAKMKISLVLEIVEVLKEAQRILSWIPESEEVLRNYRHATEKQIADAKEQHDKTTRLLERISVLLAKAK